MRKRKERMIIADRLRLFDISCRNDFISAMQFACEMGRKGYNVTFDINEKDTSCICSFSKDYKKPCSQHSWRRRLK